MPEEVRKFGSDLRRRSGEILFCQCVQQIRMRLIVESIFSRSGNSACVEIIVGQGHVAAAHLAEQFSIAVQCRVEAGLKHPFGLGCWRL